MNTRMTSDYSPTKFGSSEYNAAIHARREMLRWLTARTPKLPPVRKTWAERMEKCAKGFIRK